MGAIIDGRTLDELGLALEENFEHPAAPPTRDYTLEIPNKNGIYDFGADLGAKPFTIPLIVKPQPTREHLARAIRKRAALFFDANGKPKSVKFIFDTEPEKFYFVRYSGDVSTERDQTIGKVDWPLTAFDPHAYAASTAYDPDPPFEYDVGNQYNTGLIYPNPISFEWKHIKQYMGLYNYGFLNTPVRILIQGEIIEPTLINQTTKQRLTISAKTSADEMIIIDTEKFYVVKSTVDNQTYFLNTTFPAGFIEETHSVNLFSKKTGNDDLSLAPGLNSIILKGGLPNATVQFIWKHRFL